MSLWKPFKGTVEELNATIEKHDGYVYFCTSDGSLFFDFNDGTGNIQRKQITAKEAEAIIGHPITKYLDVSTTEKKAEIPTSKAVANFVKGKVSSLETDIKMNKASIKELNSNLLGSAEYFIYEIINSNECKIVGIQPNDDGSKRYLEGHVIIPNYYKGYKVAGIGSSVTDYNDKVFENQLNITKVTIGENIKYIAQYTFSNCANLQEVVFNTTQLAAIPGACFKNCIKLKEIIIPDSVLTIGASAFNNCGALEHISFGKSLQTINKSETFTNCTSLKSVYFNAIGMEDMASDHFAFKSLGKTSGIHLVIGKDCQKIPAYLFYRTVPSERPRIKSIEFEHNSVCTAIGVNAFYGLIELENIIFPSSLTLIDSGAFNGCTGLNKVCLPTTIQSIGSNAFVSSIFTKHAVRPSGWQVDFTTSMFKNWDWDIDNADNGYVDKRLDALKVIIDEEHEKALNEEVQKINKTVADLDAKHERDKVSYSLQYQPSVGDTLVVTGIIGNYEHKEIVIPEKHNGISVSGIADYAFEGLPISSIKIPTWVRRFGKGAFKDCTSLKSVYIDSLKNWLEITWPDETSNPLYYATDFYVNDGTGNYKELTRIQHGEDFTAYLHQYVFGRYNKITEVWIDGFNLIDADVFKYCTNLQGIYVESIPAWCAITFKNEYANPMCHTGTFDLINLEGDNPTELTLTISKENPIKPYAFYNCQSLTEIALSGGEAEGTTDTPIGKAAFKNCVNVETFNYNIINYYDSSKAVQNNSSVNDFDADNEIFANLGANKALKIVVGENVKRIPGYFLHKNTSATQVEFLDDATEIGAAAFMECTNLINVNIPSEIETIGYSAFNGCTKLRDIVLPTSLKEISNTLFFNCSGLVSIKFPKTVTKIGEGAFRFCTSLNKIEFEDDAKLGTIGALAFGSCGKLTEVSIPTTVTKIGKSVFNGDYLLSEISLPCLDMHFSKWFIPYGLNENQIRPDYLPRYISVNVKGTNIPDNYFRDCSNIAGVTISGAINNIGVNAFDGCLATIYCERTSKPSMWSEQWNSNCKVVWGYEKSIAHNTHNFLELLDAVKLLTDKVFPVNDGTITFRHTQTIPTKTIVNQNPSMDSLQTLSFSTQQIGLGENKRYYVIKATSALPYSEQYLLGADRGGEWHGSNFYCPANGIFEWSLEVRDSGLTSMVDFLVDVVGLPWECADWVAGGWGENIELLYVPAEIATSAPYYHTYSMIAELPKQPTSNLTANSTVINTNTNKEMQTSKKGATLEFTLESQLDDSCQAMATDFKAFKYCTHGNTYDYSYETYYEFLLEQHDWLNKKFDFTGEMKVRWSFW